MARVASFVPEWSKSANDATRDTKLYAGQKSCDCSIYRQTIKSTGILRNSFLFFLQTTFNESLKRTGYHPHNHISIYEWNGSMALSRLLCKRFLLTNEIQLSTYSISVGTLTHIWVNVIFCFHFRQNLSFLKSVEVALENLVRTTLKVKQVQINGVLCFFQAAI